MMVDKSKNTQAFNSYVEASLKGYSIVLQNVSKQYGIEGNAVEALNKVDLRVKNGTLAAITGKSGAGKSTLLHILGLLDKPTSGSIYLHGINVSDIGDISASNFRNRMVGFIFQMNNLLQEFSALENVMMPGLISGDSKKIVAQRAATLLDAVGLGARKEHRPGELSGGEQQRVAIARALLLAPPLILADEPTGNLDQETSLEIQDLLFKICKEHNITLILVTHDNELAQRLPVQIKMRDGRIEEEIKL